MERATISLVQKLILEVTLQLFPGGLKIADSKPIRAANCARITNSEKYRDRLNKIDYCTMKLTGKVSMKCSGCYNLNIFHTLHYMMGKSGQRYTHADIHSLTHTQAFQSEIISEEVFNCRK